jgi:glycerate kinase
LRPVEAAAALAAGFRAAACPVRELPVADGGTGTAEVLALALGGDWHEAAVADPLGRLVTARWLLLPDRTAVVESAEAIGLALLEANELDPLLASSRGLGDLVCHALAERPKALLVCLGDSATIDGGAGLLEVLEPFDLEVQVACDVRNPLLGERGAARVFAPQKGASPEQIDELEERLSARRELRAFAGLAGAGAAGGVGAALAFLGAELVEGARLVLELVRFAEHLPTASLVVTGEGAIDRSTRDGKAPWAVLEACAAAGIRCAVFGGRVEAELAGAEVHALSGDTERARQDLVELGRRLGSDLLG